MKKIPKKFKGTFPQPSRKPVNEKKFKGTFPQPSRKPVNEKKSKGLSHFINKKRYNVLLTTADIYGRFLFVITKSKNMCRETPFPKMQISLILLICLSGNAVSQNANLTNLINMLVGKRRFPKCKFH